MPPICPPTLATLHMDLVTRADTFIFRRAGDSASLLLTTLLWKVLGSRTGLCASKKNALGSLGGTEITFLSSTKRQILSNTGGSAINRGNDGKEIIGGASVALSVCWLVTASAWAGGVGSGGFSGGGYGANGGGNGGTGFDGNHDEGKAGNVAKGGGGNGGTGFDGNHDEGKSGNVAKGGGGNGGTGFDGNHDEGKSGNVAGTGNGSGKGGGAPGGGVGGPTGAAGVDGRS